MPVLTSLCFRCEHRAAFLEATQAKLEYVPCPRYECGQPDRSVCGCYMFKPCALIVMAPNEGDTRPVGGPTLFSARCHALGLVPAEDQPLVLTRIDANRFVLHRKLKVRRKTKKGVARGKKKA